MISRLVLHLCAQFAATSACGRPVTVFVAGDVMLGRGAAPYLRSAEARWRRLPIRSADIAFCNLECALATRPRPGQLVADPGSAHLLKRAGFVVVSLANNHSLDAGEEGLRTSLGRLRELGIASVGAQLGDGPWYARTEDVRGRSIAWIAASAYGPYRRGRARVRPLAGTGLLSQVRSLARAGAVVLVSLHWGIEGSRTPTDGQRRTAHALIDAGAAAVIGHHPHVAQPVETYHGRPIFYSLGNFLFDRMPGNQDGIAAQLVLGPRGRVGYRIWRVDPWAGAPNTGSSSVMPNLGSHPTLPHAEKARGWWKGRFLAHDGRPQRIIWSRRPDGSHVIRAYVEESRGWLPIAEGRFPSVYAVQIGDIDGDGRDEIILGLNQRSKLDIRVRPRIYVYSLDPRRGFAPRWRGSGLSRPFREFRLLPRRAEPAAVVPDSPVGGRTGRKPIGGGQDLIAIERNAGSEDPAFEWLAEYRWCGFGFRLIRQVPVRGKIAGLSAGQDSRGPYIRFQQIWGRHSRRLIVRPATDSDGRMEFRSALAGATARRPNPN